VKRRILIVYRVNRSDPSNIGVIKKLSGQVEGLKANKCNVDYVIHDKKHIYINATPLCDIKATDSIYFKWTFYSQLRQSEDLKVDTYDIIIFRYGLSSGPFIKCLIRWRAQNPEALFLLDMPTYPYEKEWSGIYGRLALAMDQRYRKRLLGTIDYILHSGPEVEIFGIKTIQFTNGIDTGHVNLRRPQAHMGYRLLAIGKWQYWHGLDRVIKGLASYIRNGGTGVILNVLGVGPIQKDLRSLVQSEKIEEYVFFRGAKSGRELDDYFDFSDLGVGTLGLHRKEVLIDSSLKHREYVARGLPFIMSGIDSDINVSAPFVHQVEPNDAPINIHKVIRYITGLNQTSVRLDMRKFAKDQLSWSNKAKALLDQIEKTL